MVSASLTLTVPVWPFWASARLRFSASRPAPPTTWAPMARKLTGLHLAQPMLETRSAVRRSPDSSAAALRPARPNSEPPNQAARPTSCMACRTVLRVLMRTPSCRDASERRGVTADVVTGVADGPPDGAELLNPLRQGYPVGRRANRPRGVGSHVGDNG